MFIQSFVHYFRLHKVFSLYFSRTQTIPHCHYGLQNSSSPLANLFTRHCYLPCWQKQSSPFCAESSDHLWQEQSFYIGMQVWNSLHASFYTAATLGQFKHLYKSNFKYIIIVCYHVYRALLKSSSFLLITVFPLTIKKCVFLMANCSINISFCICIEPHKFLGVFQGGVY